MSIVTTRRRRAPEHVVRLLGRVDQLLVDSYRISLVCRAPNIWDCSYHGWYPHCGGLTVDDTELLKELKLENATLSQLLTDDDELISELVLSQRKTCQIVALLLSKIRRPSSNHTPPILVETCGRDRVMTLRRIQGVGSVACAPMPALRAGA